jgi:acyl-[acyl carrier protein]--UDP-N-acetylglucosamine O-acyltransferase
MTARIHPTAVVEPDAEIGSGAVIGPWVHVGSGARVGEGSVLVGHARLGAGVRLGRSVHVEPFACLADGVTLEDGVLVGAGTVFAGAATRRAAAPDLSHFLPGDSPRSALVRAGAVIGEHCTIGGDLEVGRFAVVGMGSVVSCSVADFHLVAGSPARLRGCVCHCGTVLRRFEGPEQASPEDLVCAACGLAYIVRGGVVTEQTPGEGRRAA